MLIDRMFDEIDRMLAVKMIDGPIDRLIHRLTGRYSKRLKDR